VEQLRQEGGGEGAEKCFSFWKGGRWRNRGGLKRTPFASPLIGKRGKPILGSDPLGLGARREGVKRKRIRR